MRTLWIIVFSLSGLLSAWALEESDALFFAPFEETVQAQISLGPGEAQATGTPQFGPGVRGKAVILDTDSLLTYAFHGNVLPDEGTIMMWIKPEWRSDDNKFHRMFRASTGNFDGKALNAIMLYKYINKDRLLFYTSNGQQTAPHEGRTIADREDLALPGGEWMHLAATWSATLANTEMYLYLNGERVSAAAGAVFVPDREPETFDIGGPTGSGTTWFDDVLVFQRPLMAREVRQIFESYGSKAVPDPTDLPFGSKPELLLRPYVLFGRDELVVDVDFRGARRDLGKQPGQIEVVLSSDGEEMKAQSPAGEDGVARMTFDYKKVRPGPSKVAATLRRHDGSTVRKGETTYTVPVRPVWLGNDLGKAEKVLPPWTPLRLNGDAVEMWGREYTCKGSPLLSQAVTQEQSLLRGPIQMTVRQRGKAASLQAAPAGAWEGSDAAVTRHWAGALGPLQCKAASRIEFDGFMLLDMELTLKQAGPIDALELLIPLRHDAATLYHHANGTWTDLSDAGAVGPAGWSKALAFVPYVWIGTEKGGLAWFCEHNQNWSNADETKAVEIAHVKDGVNLSIRFIDRQTEPSEPLRLTFGFMATPVKPMPAGWRDWREMSVSAIHLEGFCKQGWAAPYVRNICHLWWTHVGAFSYLPTDPAEMRGKVQLLRDNGWQTVLSYFALDYTQVGTPDFQVMEREWRRNPYSESTATKDISYASTCNASTWADFLVYAIAKTMDETGTDGPYLDCSTPNFCQSAEHGCAPGRYPLFATRELQKRIYAVVREKRGERGFVYNHNSENNIITTFSFSDAVLNGEQYNRKDLRSLTLDKFRAELSPQPYGVPVFLLPTLIKFQPDKKEKMPGQEFLAFPLLHDVICTASWLGRDSQKLLRRIEDIMHDFGVADAEFLPYWSNSAEIAVSPEGATVSAYLRKDGKAVLLIAQGPGDFQLGLSGRLAALRDQPARNPLTDEALRWEKGKLLWHLPDRKVQLMIVGAAASH